MTAAHFLVVVGIALSVYANFAYIRNTLKGVTKPNRVTWFMWALAPLVGSIIAYYSGSDPWVTSRVFVAGSLPFLVFIFSFVNSQSYWKLTGFDITCGILSFAAFVLWVFTRQSDAAILLAIAADVFASVPTVIKAWKYPETETGITYVLFALSFIIIIPAIPVWNVQNASFQMYLLLINGLMAFLVYRVRLFRAR